jgi:ribosomal protein S18 acetylase RimI-like enzyme
VRELRFRQARAEDVGAILALVQSAYRGEASRAGWTTEADLLLGQRTDAEEVSAVLADPAARLILAEHEGALVGSVVLRAEGAPGGPAYLGMLSVRPTLQARGLGRALVAEAERVAKGELGRPSVRMTVIAQRSELIAWYARLGYTPTGEREPFPYGDARFGLPQRDDLEFVVLRKAL